MSAYWIDGLMKILFRKHNIEVVALREKFHEAKCIRKEAEGKIEKTIVGVREDPTIAAIAGAAGYIAGEKTCPRTKR